MKTRYFERVDKTKNTKLPERSTKGSAGYDFFAAKPCVIHPGRKVVIQTNVKVNMLPDEVMMVYPRSSMCIKHDLMLTNSVGVIDSDYTGQILICYRNMGKRDFFVKKGMKIAQGVFMKYLRVKGDNPKAIRVGGIGSTGE